MKKLLAVVLAAVMAFGVVACGGNTEKKESTTPATETTETTETTPVAADALEILTTVWGSYEEADKFPVGGGDAENMSQEGPAKFNVAAVEELEATFGVSADLAAQIDDAATMMHAMMANNFAMGVYHLTDASAVDTFATTLKDALLAKQWLCGQPEKVMIITIGDYVVAGYGLNDLIETFKNKVTGAYTSATVVAEESIV